MVRLMFASIVGAIGYLLLYAGIAERGRWALRPWDALTQARNTPSSDGGGSGGGSGGSSGGGGGLTGFLQGATKFFSGHGPINPLVVP